MHFQLPKPLHGWRQFAGEVGIIVLGVLIALAAQQLVEDIHDRRDVAQLRSALRAELAGDRARWEDLRASDRCTVQRLEALERWAATAPAQARLVRPYALLLWNMHSSVWDIAKTSSAVGNIPLDERLTFGDLYAAIDNWREYFAEERVNAIHLSALLESADQPESRRQIALHDFAEERVNAIHLSALLESADQPESRRQIALHVAKARVLLRRRALNYPYFFKRFDELNIRPDASQMRIARAPKALCEPLDGPR